jgi:nitrous oxidase accessory protein
VTPDRSPGPALGRGLGRRLCLALTAFAVAAVPGAASEGRQAGQDLQTRIDSAPIGSTLLLEAGIYAGPVQITGPLALVGDGEVIIEGDGLGSVIEVSGDGVELRGLTIRRSGRSISAEAAGIKASGSDHRFIDNRVEDVYFGIHLEEGNRNLVQGNTIIPGEGDGVRPGHAISLWSQRDARVEGNFTRQSRDGVYLSFADGVSVIDNDISESRYGIHSMYSKGAVVEGNRLHENLLGAALMYSDRLVLRCNRIERHREGATAYGLLLKDIDNVLVENNILLGNRVGIYADNIPVGRDNRAVIRGNLIAGNEAAMALQSMVRLQFTDNQLVDNLVPVRTEGGDLSSSNRWSVDGRGNYWDDYPGFDRDGDGVGDLPYRFEAIMEQLVRQRPAARAFLYTPAHLALESAARMFPVVRPAPLIVDDHPLMTRDVIDCPGWER